jgi:hypothetical protein
MTPSRAVRHRCGRLVRRHEERQCRSLRPTSRRSPSKGPLNAELASDGGRVFTPGQIEETLLGYDAAAVPGAAAAAVLSRVAGIELPAPVWLTPNWWLKCASRPSASVLPSRFASLLLQYKRPTLWYGGSAPLWSAYQQPYFRFEFRPKQHKTLVRLDEQLRDEALVRYAAPCTHARPVLEQWQIDRAVIANTNFVSPRRIGLRHRAWTYRTPGGVGRRNAYEDDQDSIAADSINDLLDGLNDRARVHTLVEHLSELLARLTSSTYNARVEEATRDAGVREDAGVALLAVVRLRLIGLELQNADVSWWLRERA